MANPFPTRFNSECNSCGNHVEAGELMFAVDGMFVCKYCATENGNVCPKCGAFKKENFESCFKCSNTVAKPAWNKPDFVDEDEVDPDDIPF